MCAHAHAHTHTDVANKRRKAVLLVLLMRSSDTELAINLAIGIQSQLGFRMDISRTMTGAPGAFAAAA